MGTSGQSTEGKVVSERALLVVGRFLLGNGSSSRRVGGRTRSQHDRGRDKEAEEGLDYPELGDAKAGWSGRVGGGDPPPGSNCYPRAYVQQGFTLPLPGWVAVTFWPHSASHPGS
ncbi:hypothetical protein M0R45_030480 [Rubus argutus]|uniref:Uncharacterized protein n=1 Tax=Rubus argutus TaxID=59490 RepID=A0AAW1WD45_RUBAR